MRLTDTHCHLADRRLARQVDQVLDRARQTGVVGFVCAAGDLDEARAALDVARRHADVRCTAGIHPHDAKDAPADYIDQVEALAAAEENAAVGEIGLDYYRDLSPRRVQRAVFAEQLALAARLGKTVVVHTRDALGDTLAVLADSAVDPVGVVIHSCTEDAGGVRRALEYGAAISFSGILTYRRSEVIRRAAALVPPERLLIETDCPYLSPEPVRKMRTNEPANVAHVLHCLAEARDMPPEDLAERTTANAARLFHLAL